MSQQVLISAQDLKKYFPVKGFLGGKTKYLKAVDGVTLDIMKGETFGLVGESGSGKSVSAYSLMGIIADPGKIVGGTISFNGHEHMEKMTEKEFRKIRGSEISIIFQDPMTALNPVFTVGEQIAESLELHEHLDKKAAMERAKEMLELVGIPGSRANEYPHQFSGGMKQRVVIAIALACNPKLLIADEPTTALDVTIQAQVLELMSELKEKYDTSMILITHDLGIVAEVCDTVAVMYAGRIVEQGTLEDVFDHTKHPYTEGLFNSLPNIQNRTAMLKPIKGLMPDPTNLPEGCAFAPRCDYATDECSKRCPKLTKISDTHSFACLAYEHEGFHIKRGNE